MAPLGDYLRPDFWRGSEGRTQGFSARERQVI
jgi:hypothetical protein